MNMIPVMNRVLLLFAIAGSAFSLKRTVDCVSAGGEYVPVLSRATDLTSQGVTDEFDTGLADGQMGASVLNALDQVGRKVEIANAKINMIFDQCRAQARRGIDGQLPGHCDIEDAGRCFWIVVYQNRNVSMLDAWETCAQRRGGRPAGIYSPAHFARVARLIRSKISSPRYFAFVWLGMKVEHMTQAVYLPNGKPAPYVRWLRTSYPIRNSRFNQVYFYADSSRDSGYVNYQPVRQTNGVLCEILE